MTFNLALYFSLLLVSDVEFGGGVMIVNVFHELSMSWFAYGKA